MIFSPALKKASQLCLKSACLAAACFNFMASELSAATNEGATSSESAPKSPFERVVDSLCTANAKYVSINNARTQKSDIDTRIGFKQWQVSLGSLDLKDQDGSVRSLINVGVKSSYLQWRQSPYFRTSQQHNAFIEGAHHFDLDLPVELHAHAHFETDLQARQLCKYSMATVTLWGSKNYNDVDYSLGLYKELGRHSQTLLPVLGVHTKIYENFDLDILLPFHAKVAYNLCDPCSIYAGVKTLKERQRSQPAPVNSKTIWQYRANIAHLGASYNYEKIAQGSFELGRALSPTVRVFDAEGHHLITQRVRSSLFAELSLNVFF